MKLGKLAPKQDPRTLKLASYATRELPSPPHVQAWSDAIARYEMYANDAVGCCAFATPAHLERAWAANDGRTITPTTEQVLAAYSEVAGFRPGDPSTDNGAFLLDVMNHWRKVGLYGHRIGAFASVNPRDEELTRQGIWLFGGLSIGVALPAAVQGESEWMMPTRRIRRGDWNRGSWGGHAVPVLDYDDEGLTCITWGKTLRMNWEFYLEYCDEAYAAIAQAFVGPDSKAPNGFDALQLAKDLRGLA